MDTKFQNLSDFNLGGFNKPTHYDTLNVSPSSNRITIRESYLRLKNLYASSGEGLYSLADADGLRRNLAELEDAFHVLNDEVRRAEYDQAVGIKDGRIGAAADHEPWRAEAVSEETGSGPHVIHTPRSILKVVKTKAQGSEDEEIQAAFAKIVEEFDLGDGALIARCRELLSLSENEVQERTKVSLDHIRAIENNRYERLPQAVYVKGFLRSYLRYMTVPHVDKIVKAYAERLETWQNGQ
jgi:flagellar biosynthesis protein FlhG